MRNILVFAAMLFVLGVFAGCSSNGGIDEVLTPSEENLGAEPPHRTANMDSTKISAYVPLFGGGAHLVGDPGAAQSSALITITGNYGSFNITANADGSFRVDSWPATFSIRGGDSIGLTQRVDGMTASYMTIVYFGL